MRTLADTMYETMTAADLLAAAIVKRLQPSKDEITQREAYRRYGKKWVDNATDKDLLHTRRKGEALNSPVMYSQTEILALRESEKQVVAQVKDIISKRTNKNR